MAKFKRKGMSAKNITIIAMIAIIFVAVTCAVGVVFALNQQTVNSTIAIRYVATDIYGSVNATYQLKGVESKDDGEVVDLGTVNFTGESATKQIAPTGNLELKKSTPYIELTYTFTNNGSLDYTASLSFVDIIENENISFNYAYQEYDYLTENFSILVQGVETGKNIVTYKIKMGVENFAYNAGFNGVLNWELKKPEPSDQVTQASVNLLDFTDKSDGTYSATFNGGEILDNTLVIPSEINGVKITSVGNIRGLEAGSMVVISEGITTIENSAFYSSQANNIILPDSLENVGNNAFHSSRFKSITIPASVTEIGKDVFSFSGVTEIIVDGENPVFSVDNKCLIKNLTILVYAFSSESKISDGIIEISDNAFIGRNIENVHIPSSVSIINGNPFSRCYNLKTITSDSEIYIADDNCLIKDTTLIAGCINSVIPNYVTVIGSNAFDQQTGITTIIIPDSVTKIMHYAFAKCSNLKSITLSSNLTEVGQYAFDSCLKLEKITIPESMENINIYAFNDCTSLTEVYILSENVGIGRNAFINVTATFYCVVTKQPSTWNENWAPDATEIIWGYEK